MTEAEQARADERAKVVAWLRSNETACRELARAYGRREIWRSAVDADRNAIFYAELAQAIERGDHHKEQADG